MVQMRMIRLTLVAVTLALLLSVATTLFAASPAFAAEPNVLVSLPVGQMQQGGLIDTITGKKTPSAVGTVTGTVTGTVVPTVSSTPTSIEVVIVTPTPAISPTVAAASTQPGVNPASSLVVTNPEGVIEGTVIANRSDATVQFFVEGKTWQVDPLRSAGVELARPTAVLNLFNCDVETVDQSACFWDPYLLQRDGFYEIVPGAEEGAQVSLAIRAAGSPPADQIWVQNRLASAEQVYFGAQMQELAPASVTEFTIDPATPSVFYLRTCIENGANATCEWKATEARAGTYYALTDESWQSGVPGTTVNERKLSPILGAGVSTAAESAATTLATAPADTSAISATTAAATPETVAPAAAGPSGLVCTLAVPTLNVRSGPGLAFDVISKIMTTGDTPATVTVVGRTESAEWLQVDARQANGGWVINGDAYMTCPTDTLALAVIPEGSLPATPTPLPVVAAPVTGDTGDTGANDVVAGETITATDSSTVAPVASAAPAGLALLVVQNAFEQPVRFTLDQRYRVAEGPSEVDLAPGQSTSFVVFPGIVAFSASSAWRSLSGNAEILIEADQERPLYLIFVPDPGEEGKWIFQF